MPSRESKREWIGSPSKREWIGSPQEVNTPSAKGFTCEVL